MSALCPHCNGTGRIEADPLAELRAGCEQLGIAVSWDNTISEADAARLLGKSRFTLRNRRLTDHPITVRRIGRSARYTLEALAAYLDSEQE